MNTPPPSTNPLSSIVRELGATIKSVLEPVAEDTKKAIDRSHNANASSNAGKSDQSSGSGPSGGYGRSDYGGGKWG